MHCDAFESRCRVLIWTFSVFFELTRRLHLDLLIALRNSTTAGLTQTAAVLVSQTKPIDPRSPSAQSSSGADDAEPRRAQGLPGGGQGHHKQLQRRHGGDLEPPGALNCQFCGATIVETYGIAVSNGIFFFACRGGVCNIGEKTRLSSKLYRFFSIRTYLFGAELLKSYC